MQWNRRSRRGLARAALTLIRNLVRSRLRRSDPMLPLYAVWYATLRCNLACSFCDDGQGTKYPAASYPELRTVDAQRLLELIRRACGSIYFTGGEPLMRKDLPELVTTARGLSFWPIFLNTNLSLPKQAVETACSADVLIVSLGCIDEARYDCLIGGRAGQTRRILENLEICAQRQPRGGPRVVVNCVISPGRVDDARAVWEFCQEHNFWFSPVAENRGQCIETELLLDPAYHSLVNDILSGRSRGESIYGSLRGLATLLRAEPFRCYPELTPHIYPNGDLLYPCHPLRRTTANILEKGSFAAALEAISGGRQACGNRCHLPCYISNNGWIEHPLEMLFENLRIAMASASRPGVH